MECLGNENVCSVSKENNMGYYRIHTVWSSDGFRINIASKEGAWSGQMLPENVKTACKELNTDPGQYLAECKEVLTTDDGKKGYSYTIENGCFIWKKMIDEDSGIKIRMGSVLVQPASFVETIQNIVEISLNCKKNLQKQLNTFMQQKDVEQQRVSQLQEKLDKLSKEKFIMEADLYSKFLLLLNNKKRKINELENSLLNMKEKPKVIKQLNKKCKTKNGAELKVVNLDAYEMDTDDDTDNDVEERVTTTQPKSLEFIYLQKNKRSGWSSKCKEDSESCVHINPVCKNNLISSSQKSENDVLSNSIAVCDGVPKQVPVLKLCDLQNMKDIPETKAGILDFFFGTEGV